MKGGFAMDIYKAVTDRIIAQLEQDMVPWRKPWIASGCAVSHATGKPYSLLNQMLLGKPGEYATFNQIRQAGGSVRRGEKANMVVFWKWITTKDDETGEEKEVPFLRYYNVFHLDQCEGVAAKHLLQLPQNAHAHTCADAVIADYVARERVTLRHESGDRAFYRPATDVVVLPEIAQFNSTEEYYSTAFHELTHSTGHSTRLNRLDSTAYFGSEAYSKEELIAEIGAAALLNHIGLETSGSFHNSAAYIGSWLKALRNDKHMIVSASGKAEKAVQLILGTVSEKP